MKIRILAPEVTVGGTKHEAGKEITVSDENKREVTRLERSGYVLVLDEPKQKKES